MNEIEELRACVEALKMMIHELQTMHNTAVDWRMEQDRRLSQLEATQHAHVDTSRLSETVRERIRQELSSPAAWQPLKIATETTYGTAPIVAPNSSASLTSSPAGSLLDRVAQAIYDAPNTHEGWRSKARAAILEVATWLRTESEGHLGSGLHFARRLQQEANQ